MACMLTYASTAMVGMATAMAKSGRNRHAHGLHPWGQIANQARAVIGIRHNRQTFPQFLQSQLHLGSLVHAGQQALVLASRSISTRVRNNWVTLENSGCQFILPARSPGTGLHGGAQSAVHELAKSLHADHGNFFQFSDAFLQPGRCRPRLR
jgi:hypothetical protein